MKFVFSWLLGVCGALLVAPSSWAQSIVGQELTTVTSVGNQFDISGGVPAGNNLFHSFDRFNLSAVQTANFQVPGTIQNVLSRVTGGTPSVMNGILQSTGGTQPNFYFMNPAGIVFGPSFNLNIPGSFTATTANGIAFGNNWMNATGANNYALFLGDPTAFGFTMAQPAAIINSKDNLSVDFSKSLTLIGGTVISSGKLATSGGKLTIAAVPGNSLVRITSTDSLLGLEIRPFQPADTQPNNVATPIPSIAELITGPSPDGGTVGNATGTNVNADGTVSLTGSGMSIRPGDVQTEALDSNGVLIGAPTGNVTVATVRAGDLGVDITAGKLFQATKTLTDLTEYSSTLRNVLQEPNGELLAFLQLKTGLSDAAIISKYPGLATLPKVKFPTAASVYVTRGASPGDGNIIIRHGGNSQLEFNGTAGTTVAGNAPFAIGSKVNLNSPDLADRYSLTQPGATFADLAASSPGGAIPSESFNFELRRNQTTTTSPIPANSSGTVGGIVQLVVTDGSLTVAFSNQVFGTLPIDPTNPVNPSGPTNPSGPSNPTNSSNPTGGVVTSPNGSAIASTQRAGDQANPNGQCQPTTIKIARGQAAAGESRSATTGGAGCPSVDDDDTAILKILE